jgi:biotin carboxyl carrier protein
MKYRVKIGHRTYIVNVVNIHSRPVVAIVDGEEFEVWPDAETSFETVGGSGGLDKPRSLVSWDFAKPGHPDSFPPSKASSQNEIRAPIPGVVISLEVQDGDPVSFGQEICVLESMKMKNSIRASRPGIVKAIHVVPGQTVKHGDVLVEIN